MIGVPPVEVLSALGIGFVGLFGFWKLGLQPRLARLRATRTTTWTPTPPQRPNF